MAHRPNTRTRVLVLGGGAGGLELAVALARRDDLAVTLVDRVGSHLWKPRLHEFAAGTVDSSLAEMSFYMLAKMRSFRFEEGTVERIDRADRRVHLAAIEGRDGRPGAAARTLGYDLCVVALGGVTTDFGTPGVAEHAVRLDARRDADRFRESFVTLMIGARASRRPVEIVIVGSGATGTELAAHLRFAERAFFERPARPDEASGGTLLGLTILEAAPEIMPGADEGLRRSVSDRLRSLDVSVRTGARIAAMTAREVRAEDGEVWPADIAVWAAGLVGHPVLARLADFALDGKGRILVDERLRSSVDPAIYVLGDAASLTPAGAKAPLPPTAQCASQEAAYLAEAIPAALDGRTPSPFRFADKGRLISLSHAGSVGTISGLVGRNDMLVDGRFAIAAYHSLQRRHQWSVLGPLRGTVAILADAVTPTRGPALKLHG
ncbi:FAD-dependent oxidoreductase [Aurantimonas sp. Leaf443]|uniref:NAD(P)/FAD-dependent oxidoreductase n=1 Tax=Aurantimonas sp. Leaf443 TaxID=1736378 RepID=UPI0006FE1A6F|nr:FAD-dependent oxidoreductase [Aurantimonas sp. Leaf443]KQT83092.1 NADH dehydrogenase [Aurantimonas sp. Leaf443]